MQVFLETERLVLRRFTEADLDNLFDLNGDPEVRRFLTGGKPTPREVIRNEILPRILHYYERFAGLGFWAAIEKSTGDFLGWLELRPPEGGGPDEVELGYRLRKSAWGKGCATEGARALIRKGFAELDVWRVVAQAMAVNTASRRVMEKVGLTHVRTVHEEWPDPIKGAEEGEVEYALWKADWEQQEVTGRERLSEQFGRAGRERLTASPAPVRSPAPRSAWRRKRILGALTPYTRCRGALPTAYPRSRNFMQTSDILWSRPVISWAPMSLERAYSSTRSGILGTDFREHLF